MISLTSMGEYRAYQYIVKTKVLNQTKELNSGQSIISSTLPPVAFLAYNGGANSISIDLINSWMCPGNTSHKKICDPVLMENNGN